MRRTDNFCWINVLTPEPARAREFFAPLLGWEFSEMPGMGHGVRVGGREIGTLSDLSAPGISASPAPQVGVVLRVERAAEACKKTSALGGTASPAFELMGQGQMAVCFDPSGAEFDVWEPSNGSRTGVDGRLHGAPSWFELATNDVDRAAAFYAGLFGWSPEILPVPGLDYAVFKRGEECVAGLLGLTQHMASKRPHWATFFTVRDVDLAVREALRLGGRISVPVLEVAGIGRFCGITSPQGLTFYVIAYARRRAGCVAGARGAAGSR